MLKFYYYIENIKSFRKHTYGKTIIFQNYTLLMRIDLFPEKRLQAVKKKEK